MNPKRNTPHHTSAKPLVSLIVPVYNAGKFLTECLDSIMSQTFSDFEVILVDDGSSDNSVSIIKDFCKKDSRFRLTGIPHGGVSKARNTGIDISKGKLLGFVDADDCLHPLALERMTDILRESRAQVCVAAMSKGEKFVPRKNHQRNHLSMDYSSAMTNALYQKIILNAPWGMLMERRLIGDSIRFREGIRYEDLDAFYRFYEQAEKIAYLPEKLYFYRQSDDSFIHQWSDARLDALDVTDRIVDYMTARHPELIPAALDRRFSAHFNILLLMSRLGIKNDGQIKRCLDVIREGRTRVLSDKNVRLKNKLGALVSFLGLPTLRFLARFYH